MNSSTVNSSRNLELRERIADALLKNLDGGYCVCPGQEFHKGKSSKRDCRVFLDQIPTIFCVHTSCRDSVEQMNHRLRSDIAKAECGTGRIPRISPSPRRDPLSHEKQRQSSLRRRAAKSLDKIISDYRWERADMWEECPFEIPEQPSDQQRVLLGLFEPNDIVWCGDLFHSGDGYADHFRSVESWLAEKRGVWGPHISPCVFKPGSCSRTADSVLARRYLVVENDCLSLEEQAAVLSWMRLAIGLRLHAVQYSGNRSLHGWFTVPGQDELADLRSVLEALGCDPAMFRESQPARMPGWINPKSGKMSELWFWDGMGAK